MLLVLSLSKLRRTRFLRFTSKGMPPKKGAAKGGGKSDKTKQAAKTKVSKLES